MDLWDRVLGFMDSQILLTAEELGIFSHLDREPGTAEEVAAAARLPVDSARRLLTALCSLDLVCRRQDGRYFNSTQAASELVPGKPGYIGGMFRHIRDDLYPVWRYLKEALAEGCAQWEREARHNGGVLKNERLHEDPEALRSFMEGMHAITFRSGLKLAEQSAELDRVRTIADVGGAAGSFLIALAQRRPNLRGTVFDLPAIRPIAEDFIHGHGMQERIRFQPGDFFFDPLPPGHDAYVLGFVLHDWDEDSARMLLRKVADASRPGALLLIGEYLLDDDRTGPQFVARSDLNMLVAARGRERTRDEYRELMQEAGFRLQTVYPTHCGKMYLIAERD